MIHYREMTFCPFWKKCVKGEQCERALTDEVKQAAIQWWGSDTAPICRYVNPPERCYEEKMEVAIT